MRDTRLKTSTLIIMILYCMKAIQFYARPLTPLFSFLRVNYKGRFCRQPPPTYLQVLHVWQALGHPCEDIVLQVQLSEPGQVGQTAVLNHTDLVVAQAQPGK